ncbi:MAG: ABC transporter permease, partial [Oscillibacter sp.]
AAIAVGVVLAAVIIAVLYWYFGTEQGSAIRATGSNPAMSRAQGINIGAMKVLGLALSNGLVALSGGLMVQFQGFADINMGRGAIVIGLAAVIIGEVLCDSVFRKGSSFAVRLGFLVLGGAIYYVVVVVVLWLKLDSNDLKLFTAVIVALFLAVPYLQKQSRSSFKQAGKQAGRAAEGGNENA